MYIDNHNELTKSLSFIFLLCMYTCVYVYVLSRSTWFALCKFKLPIVNLQINEHDDDDKKTIYNMCVNKPDVNESE